MAIDGLAYFILKDINEMDEDSVKIFLTYHLMVCENPELVGATAHALNIVRKQ